MTIAYDLDALAAALGEGWTVAAGYHSSDAFLDGPDGLRLHVTGPTHRAVTRGRLYFSGSFAGVHQFAPRGGGAEISVSAEKPPTVAAKDIKRRLLPRYRAELTEAMIAKARSDAEEDRRDKLAAEIAAALGPDAVNSGTGHHRHRDHAHVNLGRYGDPVDARFEVPTGDFQVVVEVRIDKAHAVALAAALAAINRPPGQEP